MQIGLTQAIHRSVQQSPHVYATIWNGTKRTYLEHVDRVARLAAGLRELGVRANDRVGILALNSDRYLEYYFAVLWAGGVLNPCNIRWSAKEIAFSLDDCDTRVLLVDDAFGKVLPQIRELTKSVTTWVHMGDGVPDGMTSYEGLISAARPMEDARRAGDDLAGVFYTGGTTGVPKGVMLTHSNLYASAIALSAALPRDVQQPVYLHAAPMFHMADGAGAMCYSLRGATHAFVGSFTPMGFLQTIEATKATVTLIVPTMVQLAVDAPEMKQFDTSSLQSVLYGASVISEPVLKRAMAAWPTASFVQAYGMTELSPVATVLPPERHTSEGPLAGKLRSGGRACQCTEVRIFDAEDREVALGTVGEVCVRGPNVMKGYWNQPELTAQALRNGWMHTGDGGYMDEDGFVFIVDRLKDMIVSGGENVYSAEVENALMQHPAVASCAVIGVPDEKWGERVHAVIVCKPGQTITAAEATTHCRTLIATYKCPRSIELRDALPISGAGKILKLVLRGPYWKGAEKRVG